MAIDGSDSLFALKIDVESLYSNGTRKMEDEVICCSMGSEDVFGE